MNNPPLLERLLAEAPFVHRLARSLVGDDADDVVQQAYLHALQQAPASIRDPRTWLSAVVRNLVADWRRRRMRRERREASVAIPEVPSSAELLAVEEARRALITAVDALPGHLRTVVLLRYYEGLAPRHIAARLGLPTKTVWNRLHAGLNVLRRALDDERDGGRRAWLLPLVPLAAAPRPLPWGELLPAAVGVAGASFGVMLMTTKTKLLVAAATLAVLAFVWAPWWAQPEQPGSGTGVDVGATTAASAPFADEGHQGERTSDAPSERTASETPPVAATGELIVRVRYAEEPFPAAGIVVRAGQRLDNPLLEPWVTATTDASGAAHFAALPPGKTIARCGLNWRITRAEVVAGERRECELVLEPAMTVHGIVVDATGAPVPGAAIETISPASRDDIVTHIATSGVDGTFVLRGCTVHLLLGARTANHAASQLYYVTGEPGSRRDARLVLTEPGGNVAATVVDERGVAVAGALVVIGPGKVTGIMSTDQGAPPLPAHGQTDDAGRFEAIGVPVGDQPVVVLAPGHAPWRGTCLVAAAATVPVRVRLTAGAICNGSVRDEQGRGVAAVQVVTQPLGDLMPLSTRTAEDGSFTLTGLPIGESVLKAVHQDHGRATATVLGDANAPARCDLTLTFGLSLRGTVVDDSGKPVPHVEFILRSEGPGDEWYQTAHGRADGTFRVPECPQGRTLAVEVKALEHLPTTLTGVDPSQGPLEVRLQRDTRPRARITGRVVLGDGSSPVGKTFELISQRPQQYLDHRIDQPDGSFSIEVAPADWTLRMQEPGFPPIQRSGLVVGPGESRDVGTLALVQGGTLVLHPPTDERLDCRVMTPADEFVCGVYSPSLPLRSQLLAPGDYVLLTGSASRAAVRLPFTIAANAETELRLDLPVGVVQRIEVRPAPGQATPRSVSLRLHQAGRMLAVLHATNKDSPDAAICDVRLVPGEYTVTQHRGDGTKVTFVVGEAAGEPVVLTAQ